MVSTIIALIRVGFPIIASQIFFRGLMSGMIYFM